MFAEYIQAPATPDDEMPTPFLCKLERHSFAIHAGYTSDGMPV